MLEILSCILKVCIKLNQLLSCDFQIMLEAFKYYRSFDKNELQQINEAQVHLGVVLMRLIPMHYPGCNETFPFDDPAYSYMVNQGWKTLWPPILCGVLAGGMIPYQIMKLKLRKFPSPDYWTATRALGRPWFWTMIGSFVTFSCCVLSTRFCNAALCNY